MPVAQVVVGASVHYARAELVTIAVQGEAPVLLDRRRVELVAPGLPIAPYHHEALELELEAATELVERVSRSVAEHAHTALSTLLATHSAKQLVLPASPYNGLPASLEEVLGSRPMTNAADGMLYRESLATAAAELGLEVRRVPRKADPIALAAAALGVDAAEVHALIARFGREAGAPWRKDHKEAAAAGLWVVGSRLGQLDLDSE